MSTEQKAKQLFDKFLSVTDKIEFQDLVVDFNAEARELARKIAAMSVEEVIAELESLSQGDCDAELTFWDDVKEHISKQK